MTPDHWQSAIHTATDRLAGALDLVEAGTNPDAGVRQRALVTAIQLASQPRAAFILLPLAGILSQAAIQIAEQTGQAPEEVIAGWRKIAGHVMNRVDEAGRAVYSPEQPQAPEAAPAEPDQAGDRIASVNAALDHMVNDAVEVLDEGIAAEDLPVILTRTLATVDGQRCVTLAGFALARLAVHKRATR